MTAALARELLEVAKTRGVMIAAAESCTGGMVAASITDIAGSSAVFERGFVTYSNTSKSELLGVAPALIEAHGAVSEEVAQAMAMGALANSHASVSVAITGIAGPGGSDHKPEGMVCFAGAAHGEVVGFETVQFGALGRAEVREAATRHALKMLIAATSQLPSQSL